MKVYLGEKTLYVDKKSTLNTILNSQKLAVLNGIAVAINDTVIPKSNWEISQLKEGDKIVVIKATAGG